MAKKLKWKFAKDSDSIRIPLKGRKAIGCCDCGLVHWFTAKVVGQRVYIVPVRDDAESERMRKKFSRKFTHKARR